MRKLIVVADWAADSLTCQEVKSAVEGFLKEPEKINISFISSTPSAIHTSFLLNQVVIIEERYGQPLETVIFQNTDPRIFAKEKLDRAKGAPPVIIKLKSGIYLCGPNAAYDFSLLKNKIDEMFLYSGLNDEGQFHSRDLYSRIAAHLMDEMEDELDLDEAPIDMIPTLEGYFIGHIDNFGNIKTTIKQEDFKGKYELGETVKVKINDVIAPAKFVDNLFGGEIGELVIYPGSSGENDNRFLEITAWQHFTEINPKTGIAYFKNPRVGASIEILK